MVNYIQSHQHIDHNDCLNIIDEKIWKEITQYILKSVKCFIINEGQFFDDLYDVVNLLVTEHNKIVYVGGLDGDFNMRKFGQMLDLIPICDKVEKLTAICSLCKNTASFTKRIIKDNKQVLIGSSDMYIPVCRTCHKS